MEYGSIFGHGAYLGPDFTTNTCIEQPFRVWGFYGGPGI